jgi:hypothetical protein
MEEEEEEEHLSKQAVTIMAAICPFLEISSLESICHFLFRIQMLWLHTNLSNWRDYKSS